MGGGLRDFWRKGCNGGPATESYFDHCSRAALPDASFGILRALIESSAPLERQGITHLPL